MTRLLAVTACFNLIVPAFANEPGSGAPLIVGGSSHICDILEALSGEESFRVRTLVPPTMCPGHFDAKPSEISTLKRARCILLHEWQAPMPVVQSVLKAAEMPPGRVRVVEVAGNCLTPDMQEAAVQQVVQILSEIEPARASEFEKKAAERVKTVRRTGAAALEELKRAGCGGMAVVCHDKLTGLLQWAGFKVAGEYGKDGQLSASRMRTLIAEARAAGVALVVDNIQGGALRTGAALARDIGAAHVVLSNFPGGFSGAETWADTLRKDVEILARAAEKVNRK